MKQCNIYKLLAVIQTFTKENLVAYTCAHNSSNDCHYYKYKYQNTNY